MIFGYDNLANHYNCNFSLIQHHKYSLTELEEMIPWERQMYLNMLLKWLQDEKERIKQQQFSKPKSKFK